MIKNRPSVVAGKFYKQNEHELYADLDSHIYNVSKKKSEKIGRIRALILPHSGYEYAGDVYAHGYAALQGQKVDEVILLGHSHYSKFENTAFSDYLSWETPLGKTEQSHRMKNLVASDDTAARDIFRYNNKFHKREHTIEVQLPWLAYLYKDLIKIIPILVGDISPRILAATVVPIIDNDDIIVASAELSHGYPADYSEIIDATALKVIEEMDSDAVMDDKFQSSAPVVIATVIEIAKTKGWKPVVLNYTNVATDGIDSSRTSGYMAVAFVE